MPGRPIQIAKPVSTNDGGFEFVADVLKLISSSEKLLKSRVVIISVAGAFRKGKSFLLNFFIRYLIALLSGDAKDWIHSADKLEDGFHWRSGSERDTAGILIWSEPFFIRDASGEEVAVLLMDTQGTFDHQTTQQDCTTIFAFSTLLSSVQIFNISQNIQETDLQYLRLFVEFAAMAKNSKEKVLQHLCFLVRDWQYPDEYEYGVTGGKSYLRRVLTCDDEKPRENQELRQGILQHFERSSCCLLPHPGKAVTAKAFQGEVHRLDCDFVEHLEKFVSHVLSPSNLVVKKVNGKELTGQEFFRYVEVYFQAFCNGQLPTPKSIFTATVEMANLTAATDAHKFFDDRVKSLTCQAAAIIESQMSIFLTTTVEQAMEQFDSKCMEKTSRDTVLMRQRLNEQLKCESQYQQTLNSLKSDRVSAEEKNRMLGNDIQRMRSEKSISAQKLVQIKKEFDEKVREIRSRSISKEEMEKLLQEERVKFSVSERELTQNYQQKDSRMQDMVARNTWLASEIERARQEAMQQQQAMAYQLRLQQQRNEEAQRLEKQRLEEARRQEQERQDALRRQLEYRMSQCRSEQNNGSDCSII